MIGGSVCSQNFRNPQHPQRATELDRAGLASIEIKRGQRVGVPVARRHDSRFDQPGIELPRIEEQRARIAAAEALHREAAEHVRHVEDDLTLARVEREYVEKLVKNGALASQDVDRASNLEFTTANELEAARYRLASAKAQVEVARSGLIATRAQGAAAGELVQIRAPVTDRILRIVDTSERVVSAGAPTSCRGPERDHEVAELAFAFPGT
jgi:hypothetical protein